MRHYLPIRRDLGNLDEVLYMIKDHALLEEIASRAFEEIYQGKKYTYTGFAKVLEAEFAAAPRRHAILPWTCVKWLPRASVFARQMGQRLVSVARWCKHPTIRGRGLGIRTTLRKLRPW